MNDQNRPGKTGFDHLVLDGRPLDEPPPPLHAATLDEADSGLYRRQVSTPRSTYDPFMASFGEVSLAENLGTKYAGRRQRIGAWLLLVLPSAFFGCLGTLQAWDRVAHGEAGVPKALLGALAWWLPTVFWLYVIYRRPTGKP